MRKTVSVEQATAQDSHVLGISTLDRPPQPLLALLLILQKTITVEQANAQDSHVLGITTLDRLPQPLLALPLFLRKTVSVEQTPPKVRLGTIVTRLS